MEMRLSKCSLRRWILTLTATVLACVTQLDAAEPTTRPAKPLDAQGVFAQASPAVVRIRIYSRGGRVVATGSGFLIDPDGTIVTNHHVIKGAASASVFMQGRSSLPVVRIIATDEKADVAIIKVEGKNLPFLKLRTELPKIGEKVYAIGSPAGLTNTLSDGLVSGLRREGAITLIQISAPISHGSSGGALLDSRGKVLGVTTSGIAKGENLGFVVPSERIVRLVKTATATTQSTPKLATPPRAGVAGTPKAYSSIRALLSQIPGKLTAGKGKYLSVLQATLVDEWLAKNVPLGSMLAIAGRFAEASGDSGGITLTFEGGDVLIHGKRIYLRASAYLDGRFAQKVMILKRGAAITIHGKIMELRVVKRKGVHNVFIHLCLRLTECGFGKIPPSRRTTTRPKPKPAAKSAEQKAQGMLKLAKMYLSAGKKARAIEILKGIVSDYPGTHATGVAAKELKELEGGKGTE